MGVSEDQKLAVVHSGVLSELHRLLQKQTEPTPNQLAPAGTSQEDIVGPEDKIKAVSDSDLERQVPHTLVAELESSPASGPSLSLSSLKADVGVHSDVMDGTETAPDSDQVIPNDTSEPLLDQNTSAIRQPADSVFPSSTATVDRAIELRDSAFAILDAIATNASDHGMEAIADAYVFVGIHTALVDLLK